MRPDKVRIILAQPRDVPALVELLAQLFSQEADFVPDPNRQRRGLLRIMRQPDTGSILVMKERDTVIGMVNLLFTVSTAEGGRVAWLEDLIIAPNYRGRGLGTILMQVAVQYLRRKGISRITLLTDRTNRRAIRFYEQQGFARSKMIPLRLSLNT